MEQQQLELQLEYLQREQSQDMVYPTCPSCNNRGNIFVFQAVSTENVINEHQLSETIPTFGTGTIYCIKCGYIVGTANRAQKE